RHDRAVSDFDQVLKLSKGTMEKAYLMKGNVYAREGRWKEAKEMAAKYTKKDSAKTDLLFGIAAGEKGHKSAYSAQVKRDWDECVKHTTVALETATHSAQIRSQR